MEPVPSRSRRAASGSRQSGRYLRRDSVERGRIDPQRKDHSHEQVPCVSPVAVIRSSAGDLAPPRGRAPPIRRPRGRAARESAFPCFPAHEDVDDNCAATGSGARPTRYGRAPGSPRRSQPCLALGGRETQPSSGFETSAHRIECRRAAPDDPGPPADPGKPEDAGRPN